jgi:hypothetical protein
MFRLGLARTIASWSLGLSSLWTLGCGEGPTEVIAPRLPANMRLDATASGVAGDRTIDCALHYQIRLTADGALTGTWGGEASRQSLLPDGSGIAFFADAASDLRIDPLSASRVRLISYGQGRPLEPDGTSRFWDGILVLEGDYDEGASTVTGVWTCHPMDTRGDDVGSIAGTWTAGPQ